jgi:hypothetical protein
MNVREVNDTRNSFPKIMKHSGSDLIVFFFSEQYNREFDGVVVIGNELWEIGEYSRNWNIKEFSEYDGNIILSNF